MRYTIITFFLCLSIAATSAIAQSNNLAFKGPSQAAHTKALGSSWTLPTATPDSHGCKANHVTSNAYQSANAQQRAIIDAAEAELENAASGMSAVAAALNITIPVVVHVVHNNGVELIGEYQITDAITQMNEDFAAQPNVTDGFGHLQANVGYTFKLAKLDPNGNPTSGITYTQSTITNNGSEGPLQSLINWPREKYLNVWVVKSSDGGNGSAYSNYPSSVANGTGREHWDGIVTSHWAMGRTGTAVSTHYKIMTHEAGHWANLKHTWGDQTEYGTDAACNDDDGVSDTPNTKGNGGCGPLVSCGTQDNEQNFMDYGNCSTMFTFGQAARMDAAMQSSVSGRNNIWSHANLVATGLASGSSSGGSSSGGSSSGGSSSGGSLSNGQTVTGLAATQGNRTGNYYIDVPSGASNLTITISGGTGDADLYVKKDSVPTDSSYDCRPYVGGNAETCGAGGTALPTSTGRFHINLKAYAAFTGVSLTASYTSGGSSSGGSSSGGSSSGGSSSGGSSSGGSSSGGSSSGGALTNGQTVGGIGASQGNRSSNYYIDVPSGASNLAISISGGSGDADLYVKKGSVPTDSSYDCRPYASGNAETCGAGGTALPTSEGRFHINMKAYSTFSGLSLTASYTAGGSSSGGSSSGGSSSGGSSSGGSSSGGSSSGGGLQNGSAITVSGAQNEESFYTMNVPAGASNLKFETSGGTGDVDLYVRFGSQPTTSTYDCRPWKNGNAEVCDINPAQAGTYHIMLNGYNAYSNVSLEGSYTP